VLQNPDSSKSFPVSFPACRPQTCALSASASSCLRPTVRILTTILVAYLSHFHERQVMQLDAINALPLYPNENVLWDMNLVPSTHYAGETSLALPKLNTRSTSRFTTIC